MVDFLLKAEIHIQVVFLVAGLGFEPLASGLRQHPARCERETCFHVTERPAQSAGDCTPGSCFEPDQRTLVAQHPVRVILCPACSDPASSRWVAKQWRKVCGLTGLSILASFAAALTTRCNPLGSR